MLKRIISILAITVTLLPWVASAAEDEVTVSLPMFDVFLNDVKIDNDYNQYPLIVYKDITYFPMTYDDCRFLGIETQWEEESGLKIEKTDVTVGYKGGYKQSQKNTKAYKASIPNFKITLNNKVIDNSKEEYPLIVFRDVTYFPLTWRFAVEEFGWEYGFEGEKGLDIQSKSQSVKLLNLLNMKDDMSEFIIYKGFYYYKGDDEGTLAIYRAPTSKPLEVSEVYRRTIEDPDAYSNANPRVSFFEQEGKLYFSYHLGGAVMGEDIFCGIDDKGIGEEIISGYLDFREYGEDMVVAWYGVPPSSGNLYMSKANREEQIKLGQPSYMYGWVRQIKEKSTGFSHNNNMKIVDGWVYVTGVDMSNDEDLNKLYKIKIDSNEIQLLSDIPASDFTIIGDQIFFIGSEDRKLYCTTSDGKDEKVLIDTPIDDFIINGDSIYYISEDKDFLKLNNDKTVVEMMPNKKVDTIDFVQEKLICILEENEALGLAVLNKNGEFIFKTADQVMSVTCEGKLLAYKTSDGKNIFTVALQ